MRRMVKGVVMSDVSLSYPPLEGEGRLAWSEAKCETGWGDSLHCGHRSRGEAFTPPRPEFSSIPAHPPPPGEGKKRKRRNGSFASRPGVGICIVAITPR